MANPKCKVCGEDVDYCECPTCPVCGEHGNPECYKNMEHTRHIAKKLGYDLAKNGLEIAMGIAEETTFFSMDFDEYWDMLLNLFHEGFRQCCKDVYDFKIEFDDRCDKDESEDSKWKDCERIQEVLKRFGVEKSIEGCRSLWSEYSDDMCAGWLLLSDSDEMLIKDLKRLGHIPE